LRVRTHEYSVAASGIVVDLGDSVFGVFGIRQLLRESKTESAIASRKATVIVSKTLKAGMNRVTYTYRRAKK
jgi:hypothetical protein